jgi:probable HAF family extracellular repeat protein
MQPTHATEPARTQPRASKQGRKSRLAKWSRIAMASAVAATGLGVAAAPALADGQGQPTTYKFETLDNASDPTFNQLLGINDHGVIAGYFGSGVQDHPNKGYLLFAPYGQRNYLNENFPGSVQTQVTGLNNRGVTVGFWSSMNNADLVNDNHGFVDDRGHFRNADDPNAGSPGALTVDQLLGVNDNDVAVGFYTDAQGNNHGYEYNIRWNRYSSVVDPNAPGTPLSAAAINDRGDVAGIYTNPVTGATDGFVLSRHGQFTDLAVPGAASTNALGINNLGEVVGVWTDAAMNTHGFTWTREGGFQTVDEPQGQGTTTINGVNDEGQVVGFYTDAATNVDGFLATPVHHRHS